MKNQLKQKKVDDRNVWNTLGRQVSDKSEMLSIGHHEHVTATVRDDSSRTSAAMNVSQPQRDMRSPEHEPL